MGNVKTYPIEKATEKVLLSISHAIDEATRYLFKKRNKYDRIMHTMELLAWIFLTISIIMNLRR